MRRDLAHAGRSLAKARAFTFVCIVSLGIGMAPVIAIPYVSRLSTLAPPGVNTDKPVQLKVGEKTVITTTVAPGDEGAVQVAPQGLTGPAQTVKIAEVMQVNPPPVRWTGTLALNGMFETGQLAMVGDADDAVFLDRDGRVILPYKTGRIIRPTLEEYRRDPDAWRPLIAVS